jgi:hypothetical protein
MYIIGRGRNARETYPTSPGSQGGGGGGSLLPPLDVAAGSTVALSHGGQNNLWFESGEAQSTAEFAVGQGGDLVRLKCIGDFSGEAGPPLRIVATGGVIVEEPGTPGTYTSGTTSFATTGGCLTYQCDTSTPGTVRWGVVSSF